jgi:tRNA pseudouridine55 synthase
MMMVTDGFFILDKPEGLSSRQASQFLKKKHVKIGHVGTLDPFATGVLPIAIGEGCKCIPRLKDVKKIYDMTMKFGEETDSGDLDGIVIGRSYHIPFYDDIVQIIPLFLGNIIQETPQFSAIKIQGKRSYEWARQGISKVVPKRIVTIIDIGIHEYHYPYLRARVTCEQGTYIRTLAMDIAKSVNCVAHLTALRRVYSCGFFEKHLGTFMSCTELIPFLNK